MAQTQDSSSNTPAAAAIAEPDVGLAATIDGPSLASADDLILRGSSLGRYLVLERLGSGAMGVVYAAYDPKLDRRVAIKLLRSDAGDTEARQRLLREAQAMAQLSHSNVISVFDVGTFNDQIFVAMEYAQGSTLGHWLTAAARSSQQILSTFLLAGQGLAAAHRGGLVHRDFKPDNVLVGDDGRVRVADFGLARRVQNDEEAAAREAIKAAAQPVGADLKTSPAALNIALTNPGSLLGTPAYMSPEQFCGFLADERSDQFSFCVALYEALYGEEPFAGDDLASLALNVMAGRVRPPPPKSHIPLWLRLVLLRGLRPARQHRYPSMDALLKALTSDPRRARRQRVLALLGIGIVLLSGVGYREYRKRTDALCNGARSKLAGVWDSGQKQTVHAAFLATGLPYAEDAWQRTKKAIDHYTDSWVAMHTEACQATYIRGEQSPALLDLRMQCLHRRLQDVEAFTALLGRADGAIVEKSVEHSTAFPLITSCADVEALTAPVAPPDSPAMRERVNALYQQLAQVRAFEKVGKYTEVLRQARDAAHAASQLGYRPAEAEALYLLGELEAKSGDPYAAEGTFYRAAVAAKAGRYHKLEAQAWSYLTLVVGYDLKQPEQGYRWADLARAAVDATLGNEEAKALLLSSLGNILASQLRWDEALASHREAKLLHEKLYGPSHLEVAADLNNLAIVLRWQGKLSESLAMHLEALRIEENTLGPMHPSLAQGYRNIALVLRDQGQLEPALGYLQKALEIRQRVLGETHAQTLDVWFSIAKVRQRQGRTDDARSIFERVLAAQEKSAAPADVAHTRFALAELLGAAGKDRARAVELAQAAQNTYAASGESNQANQAELAKIQAWLAQAAALNRDHLPPGKPK